MRLSDVERLALRHAMRSVCDEKIDVHVMNPSDLTAAEEAFLGTIRPEKLAIEFVGRAEQ